VPCSDVEALITLLTLRAAGHALSLYRGSAVHQPSEAESDAGDGVDNCDEEAMDVVDDVPVLPAGLTVFHYADKSFAVATVFEPALTAQLLTPDLTFRAECLGDLQSGAHRTLRPSTLQDALPSRRSGALILAETCRAIGGEEVSDKNGLRRVLHADHSILGPVLAKFGSDAGKHLLATVNASNHLDVDLTLYLLIRCYAAQTTVIDTKWLVETGVLLNYLRCTFQ
jgi:hypothetical protein